MRCKICPNSCIVNKMLTIYYEIRHSLCNRVIRLYTHVNSEQFDNQSLASYFFATQIYSFYMQNILHKSSWCEKDWNARMTISIHFLQATLILITNWMSIEIRYVSLDLIGVDLWALQWSILKYIKRLYIITFVFEK